MSCRCGSTLFSARLRVFSHVALIVFSPVPLLARKHCAVDRIDGNLLSESRFEFLYRNRAPVILQNVTDDWTSRVSWQTAAAFAQRHGGLTVKLERQVSHGETENTGVEAPNMTIAEYVLAGGQNHVALSFDSYTIHQAIRAETTPIPALLRKLQSEPILSLGRKDTGVDFHRHDENWIAQVSGRKVWFLAPPEQNMQQFRGQEPCSFKKQSKMIPSSCTVHPGEVLYLPSEWHHATCNLDDFTVGVGGRGETTLVHEACGVCALDDLLATLTVAPADDRDVFDRPALHVCAAAGCVDGAALLLSQSAFAASIDARADYLGNGEQAIHVAAKNGHIKMVEMLVDRGASVTAEESHGWEPIHLASFGGHTAVVETLVRRGASVGTTDHDGKQPLHGASMNGHVKLVERLVELGANVSAGTSLGAQPLHFAAYKGHVAVVERLVALGASVTATDERGNVPAHWAEFGGHKKVIEALVHGAKSVRGEEL